jgi:hypothetical protein
MSPLWLRWYSLCISTLVKNCRVERVIYRTRRILNLKLIYIKWLTYEIELMLYSTYLRMRLYIFKHTVTWHKYTHDRIILHLIHISCLHSYCSSLFINMVQYKKMFIPAETPNYTGIWTLTVQNINILSISKRHIILQGQKMSLRTRIILSLRVKWDVWYKKVATENLLLFYNNWKWRNRYSKLQANSLRVHCTT